MGISRPIQGESSMAVLQGAFMAINLFGFWRLGG
jgi:hypothetical protein